MMLRQECLALNVSHQSHTEPLLSVAMDVLSDQTGSPVLKAQGQLEAVAGSVPSRKLGCIFPSEAVRKNLKSLDLEARSRPSVKCVSSQSVGSLPNTFVGGKNKLRE